MSTSEEILQALQQVAAGVEQGAGAANAAQAKAEQAVAQAVALGVRDKIAEFTGLKGAIEELIASLSSTRERAVQVEARARTAAG